MKTATLLETSVEDYDRVSKHLLLDQMREKLAWERSHLYLQTSVERLSPIVQN